MELAVIAVSALTLFVTLGVLVYLLRSRSGSNLEPLHRELEDLRQQVGRDVDSVREQSRTSFEQTSSVLSKELRSSREELGKIAMELRGELDKKLGETVTKNLENFSAVTEKLGKLHEATGQIVELSQGIHDLNVLLKTPTGRGAFGEMTLTQMLGDLFGEYTEMFETQYAIEDAERVDAAIFVNPDKSQCVCVDAKFPLANATPLIQGRGTPEIEKEFSKDVKARAEEIRVKYIRPPKTLDFAFMFIPSEAVYYLVLRNEKLHQDLLKKRVIPSSPNSFYAYLQALAAAFRGMKIEKKTKELQKAIQSLGKDFRLFANDFRRLGTHVRNAGKVFGEADHRLDKFRDRIALIEQGDAPEKELSDLRSKTLENKKEE